MPDPNPKLEHWYWRKLNREKGGHVQPSAVKQTPPDVGAKHPRQKRELDPGAKSCPTCKGRGYVFRGNTRPTCETCGGTGVVPA